MPAHLRMTPARRALYALLVCATSAPSASACCLTDWLYGRQPTYAIAPAVTVTPGYAETSVAAPYMAGYTPVMTAVPTTSFMPMTGVSAFAQPSSVQQPAYGAVPLNNPSVYSETAFSSGFRGAVPAGGFTYGTGNVYPNTFASASPAMVTAPATAYQANYGSSVQLPVTPTYVEPQQGGLSRFFDSMLGTGYRTSYYTAPITYYRPATMIDPVTGATVTVQQSCESTVEQVQRAPFTTFAPSQSFAQAAPAVAPYDMNPGSGVAPCSATAPCESAAGTYYGASTIPSTSFSDGYGTSTGNATGNGDLQPLSPPTLPPNSAFSGRLGYPNDAASGLNSSLRPMTDSPFSASPLPASPLSGSTLNTSPLTGSPLTGSQLTESTYSGAPSYQREVQPDLEPLSAPSLLSAKPAYSDPVDSSKTVDDAYRQGYEAGRTATVKETKDETSSAYAPYVTPEPPKVDPYASSSGAASEPVQPPAKSRYQLNPPDNSRPSTDDSGQRTQFQIEQDARDLKGLTTGSPNTQGNSRFVNDASESAPRVRPIPAPDGYHNPFDTTERLKAPNLLPALPPPSSSYYRGTPQTSGHSTPQRARVQVREASIHGTAERMPVRAAQDTSQSRVAEPQQSPPPRANAWQANVRQQSQSSGWHTTGQ